MWHAHKQLHSCIQKEDEDTKDCFDRFKNQAEVTENNGGELGTENELMQQDETFTNSLQSEKQDVANMDAAKERTREKFLACGDLEI